MKMNWIRSLAVAASIILGLTGCSSGGNCSGSCNPPSPALSLAISAPNQYPAGIEVTAYLTITNTSTVNAQNLYYTVPDITNSTGAMITIANGASQPCLNIAAGASCTFPALISANSHPGSFTVLATPNGSASGASVKTVNNDKVGIKSTTLSLTANIGLVDTPNTQNILYILPTTQTANAAASGSTIVMLSVLVKNTATENIQSIALVDQNGTALNGSIVGVAPTSYPKNTVVTYSVQVPAGIDLQKVQAVAYNGTTAVCALNTGANNASACSNIATINLSAQGTAILQVDPTLVYMSESYASQVFTLTNTGMTGLSSLTVPTFSAPLSVATNGNTCKDVTSLSVGQSCKFTVQYAVESVSAKHDYTFSYFNGNQSVQTQASIVTLGTVPSALIFADPTTLSLTSTNPTQTVTFTNFGRADATITNVLLANSSVVESVSTTCVSGEKLVSPVTSLDGIAGSCTYTVTYKAGVGGATALNFTYNNGVTPGQVTSVPINYAGVAINATLHYGSESGPIFTEPAIANTDQLYVVFALSNASPTTESQAVQVTSSNNSRLNATSMGSSCSLSYESPSCSVIVTAGGNRGLANLSYSDTTEPLILISPESSAVIYVSTAYVYVANLANGSTALHGKNDIYKCLRNSNDGTLFNNCKAQNVPMQISNPSFHPNALIFTFNDDGVNYLYATDSSNNGSIVKCVPNQSTNGNLTECQVTGSPTAFSNVQSFNNDYNLGHGGESNILYISNQSGSAWGVSTCIASAEDGSLSNCNWQNPFASSHADLVGFVSVGSSYGFPIESYANVSYYVSQPTNGSGYNLYRSESINYDVSSLPPLTYMPVNYESSGLIEADLVPSTSSVTFFSRILGTRNTDFYYLTNTESTAYLCKTDTDTLEFLPPCTATGSGFSNPHGLSIGGSYGYIANFTTNTPVSMCDFGYVLGDLDSCGDSGSGTFSNANAILTYEAQD